MGEKIYKLPLDEVVDSDLLSWINGFPRNKKAEVVRHALRFYKSQLKEGETFIMPAVAFSQNPVPAESTAEPKPEKKQRVGLRLDSITKIQD